jgi:hypothetical protein
MSQSIEKTAKAAAGKHKKATQDKTEDVLRSISRLLSQPAYRQPSPSRKSNADAPKGTTSANNTSKKTTEKVGNSEQTVERFSPFETAANIASQLTVSPVDRSASRSLTKDLHENYKAQTSKANTTRNQRSINFIVMKRQKGESISVSKYSQINLTQLSAYILYTRS